MRPRPLHLVWIVDCSGSMGIHGKIQGANNAIREVLPHLRRVDRDVPSASLQISAITFADTVEWVAKEPQSAQEFTWTAIQETGGCSPLGAAVTEASERIREWSRGENCCPPIFVLVTDGFPTDDDAYALLSTHLPAGKMLRLALMVGEGAAVEFNEQFIRWCVDEVVDPSRPERVGERVRRHMVETSTEGEGRSDD